MGFMFLAMIAKREAITDHAHKPFPWKLRLAFEVALQPGQRQLGWMVRVCCFGKMNPSFCRVSEDGLIDSRHPCDSAL